MHCNGTDASTTFTDSATGKAITANGNAQIDTAQSKFGGASGLVDGTGDYLSTPDHDDFSIGSGNFTVDCWIKRAATGATHGICSLGITTNALGLYIYASNLLYGHITSTTTTTYTAQSSGTIGTGWTHVAFVRNGNTLTLYINGTADRTKDVTGITANNPTGNSVIGLYSTSYFNGWIDEFRYSKGIARWTANFTPSTQPYSRPSGFFFLNLT